MPQELSIKVPAWVSLETGTVVGTVYLSGGAETLTGWSTNNDIHMRDPKK